MGNKQSAVFVGIYACPNCGNIATFNALPERKRIPLLFGLTGIPFCHTVRKFAFCSHCGYRKKLKGELEIAYKRALENHFDDNDFVNHFFNQIEEICISYNVILNGDFVESNFEKALDEIYANYAPQQGYDREFYSLLCQVCAARAESKLNRYKLMFRT